MGERSDLRNPHCFPPALDTALVIPFSAWCQPFPFPLQRLFFQALYFFFFLAFYPSESFPWEPSFSPRRWTPGRCVPAGTLLLLCLFAVALTLQVPFTVPAVSFLSRIKKIKWSHTLFCKPGSPYKMQGGWLDELHFVLYLSNGVFQVACLDAPGVQGVM